MSKQRKRAKRGWVDGNQAPPSPGVRAAVVAWVMCTLTAFLGELSVGVLVIVIKIASAPTPHLGALAVILALGTLLAGLIGLAILPFVLRLAKGAIPRLAIAFSVAICLLPVLFLLGLLGARVVASVLFL